MNLSKFSNSSFLDCLCSSSLKFLDRFCQFWQLHNFNLLYWKKQTSWKPDYNFSINVWILVLGLKVAMWIRITTNLRQNAHVSEKNSWQQKLIIFQKLNTFAINKQVFKNTLTWKWNERTKRNTIIVEK